MINHKSYIHLILFLSVFLLLLANTARATNYYASPNGSSSNTGLSQSSPIRIADFWTKAKPGDTLFLMNGTYTGNSSMIHPTISGTAGSPITIKALNDGKAIIDGEYGLKPLYVGEGKKYLNFEGFVTQRSSWHVVYLYKASNIVLRRISAYNADTNSNSHCFSIEESSQILVEDCAASGSGRNCFLVYRSDHVTLRRCWGKWMEHTYGGPRDWCQIYGSSYCTIENCIGLMNKESTEYNVECVLSVAGSVNWGPANNNRVYGCFFADCPANPTYGGAGIVVSDNDYQQSNNYIENCVVINNEAINYLTSNDDNAQFKHITSVGLGIDTAFYVGQRNENYTTNVILKNSVFINGERYGLRQTQTSTFMHSYNDIFNFASGYYSGTTEGEGEIHKDPGFNTAKYGKGAYLMHAPNLLTDGENNSPMGAEVLYRYVDGVLTDEPLWPWPMEERIKAETLEILGTTISPTYEAYGGIWKTLEDVYDEAPPPPPPPPADEETIVDLRFDEGSGTTAYDSSGNNNNGILINGPLWTAGRIGSALSFDGNNDYVQIAKSASLDSIVQGITLEAWVKPSLTNRHTLLARWLCGTGVNQRSYEFDIQNDGRINFALSGDGTSTDAVWLTSNKSVSPDTWIHLAATSDGTTMMIYINGEQDLNTASSPNGIHSSAGNLHIGRWLYSSPDNWYDSAFNGIIDQVKVYNYALSAEEILSHYQDASPYQKGDLNNDGYVNSADWTIMKSKWQTNDPEADLNNDNIVNTIDFSILNNNWSII